MSGCAENCWPIATDKRCLPQRHKEHKVEEAEFAQLIRMRLPHPLLLTLPKRLALSPSGPPAGEGSYQRGSSVPSLVG